jgi:endonuclease-3
MKSSALNSGLAIKTPTNWQNMLDKISEYRSINKAPVDTIGCERLYKSTIPSVIRYEILTSLQLSPQTKDEVTAQAMINLQDSKGGLNIDSIIEMTHDEVDSCISKVGFHTTKSKNIKKTAMILKDLYNSDVPDTLKSLLSLPGVGPKIAHLTLQAAWNKTVGIGVDTHVHRISNRMGWTKTTDADKTRKVIIF